MANSKNLPPTTAFSRAFASALREVMAARGITQTKVAKAINRDQTFVSERTSGKRACDTDIIAGIAEVAGESPQDIVKAALKFMRGEGGATVTPLPTRPSAPTPNVRRTRPKVAKTSPEEAGAPEGD